MKLSKMLEWGSLIFAGALFLFAGVGLLLLGKIGLSYLTPVVNTVLSNDFSVTRHHVALYQVMFFAGISSFVSSFVIFFRLIIKNLPN